MINSNIIKHVYQKVRLLKGISSAFGHCILCKAKHTEISLLCSTCLNDLITFEPHTNLLNQPKFSKDLQHHYIDNLICLAPYQWPISTWINQLKYQQNFEFSTLLSQLLIHNNHSALSSICSEKSATLMNVPVHMSRWQKRGYNQSHLIAKKIAKAYACSYHSDSVVRVKATDRQVGKSGSERRTNLKNAFILNPYSTNSMPEHVIIIDDVITTGTTANELARFCKRNGASSVSVVTLALAIKQG